MSQGSGSVLTQIHEAITAEGMTESLLFSTSGLLQHFDPSDLDEAAVLKLRDLLELFSSTCDESTITNLFMAIQRYPPRTLTPVHHFVVRQCCKLRTYDLAIPLLDQPIDHFFKSHHLTYHDHLLYHFYGGLCLTALRDYSRASMFFSMTLAAGGRDTSLIQLDAYKKYILVELIHRAKLPEFPRTTHNNVRRALEILSVPYLDLADVFLQDSTNVNQVVEKYRADFARDGNTGLLNSALASIPSHKILKISQVYSSLRLSQIGSKLSISESEVKGTLASMVADNRISATIDSEGWVAFPIATIPAEKQLEELYEAYKKVANLNSRMTQLQKSLELDPDYVTRQTRSGGGSESTSQSTGKGKGKGKAHGPSFSKMDEDSESEY